MEETPVKMEESAVRDRRAVFVVVPVYNEATVVGGVLREIARAGYTVVAVDDGSTDETYRTCRRHAHWTLRHVVNRGQGAALQTGMAFALRHGAEVVVTMDADGQHRTADVETLAAPIRDGEADIVLGSRFLGSAVDMPLSRRWLLRAAVAFTRLVNGLDVTDAHNGLRAFSRRAAERIDIRLDRMAHASELLDLIAATGLPYREVPVDVRYTTYSQTKGQRIGHAPRILLHYFLGRVFG
jgi:glycosyltransferase involved in cell wall biosynthesis